MWSLKKQVYNSRIQSIIWNLTIVGSKNFEKVEKESKRVFNRLEYRNFNEYAHVLVDGARFEDNLKRKKIPFR